MEVEYELTQEDYQAFNRYHYQKGPGKRGHVPKSIQILLAVVGGAILTITLILGELYHLGVMPGMLIGLVVAWCWINLELAIRRRYALGSLSDTGKTRYSLAPDGIRWKSASSEGLYLWSGIGALGKTRDRLFIYVRADQAFIFPRRAFPNDKFYDAFIDQVDAYLDVSGNVRFRGQSGSSDKVKVGADVSVKSGPPA